MGTRRINLSKALADKILGAIRAGAYPFVAAEAFGVPKHTFESWLNHGEHSNSRSRYRSFAKDTREAAAVARLLLEAAVYKEDPKTWLIHGPGRETSERPGWSVSVKPAEVAAEIKNALCIPEVMQLFNRLIDALCPFPDAREHVAQVFTEHGLNLNLENQHGTTSA